MSINSLGEDNWKDYLDVASSYWHFARDEDDYPKKKEFHGSFVIQVARNLINRYTHKGDLVMDFFGGSGTTYRACKELERDSILFDLRYRKGQKKKFTFGYTGNLHLAYGYDVTKKLPPTPPAKLTILHPPYFDVIQFSDKIADLSTMSVPEFFSAMDKVFENAASVTADGGFVALIMGDIYKNSELIPASVTASLANTHNLLLKALYVKNMTGNEVGKGKNTNLWKYRALMNGFSTFDHEYVYVWRKTRKHPKKRGGKPGSGGR